MPPIAFKVEEEEKEEDKRSRFLVCNLFQVYHQLFISVLSKLSDVCTELSSLPRQVCRPLVVSPLMLQTSHLLVTLLKKMHSLLGHLARTTKSMLS